MTTYEVDPGQFGIAVVLLGVIAFALLALLVVIFRG